MLQETLLQQIDTELTELTAIVEAGLVRSKKRVKLYKKRYHFFTAAYMVLLLGWCDALSRGVIPSTGWLILIGCGGMSVTPIVLVGSLLWLMRDRSREQEHTAVKRLMEIDDVRAVAPLMDAMQYIGVGETRLKLWQGLGSLWPRLSEEDVQNLGAERHGLLATWMQGWDNPLTRKHYAGLGTQSLLGVLHVLGHVGQSSIQTGRPPVSIRVSLLPILKKWEAGIGAGRDPAVQQAAIVCREAIQYKTSLAGSSAQLLRASTSAPSGPETLLRPAQGTQQTEPGELLRPHDPEETVPSANRKEITSPLRSTFEAAWICV